MGPSEHRREAGGFRRVVRNTTAWLPVSLALAWLFGPEVRPAAALHFVQEGLGCYACHTLDANEGEANTSLINRTSRTMIEMKAANANATPAQFGCTYCHNIGSRARMRAVLNDFSGKASVHPVGKNFVSGAETGHEFLSAWNTAFADELDCVDCHDVEGQGDGSDDPSTPTDESSDGDPATSALSTEFGSKYPEHGPPAYAANPYMLRSVAALNEYDPLCRTCHGNAAPLVKGSSPTDNDVRVDPATSHADGVPVANGGSGPIVEDDGTQLKTTAAGGNDQCRACHDTHYSNRQVLFNDGHERISGTSSWETAIDAGIDCTVTCHYPGDAEGYAGEGPGLNTYTRSGHGMPTAASGAPLGLGCGSCHTVTERHDSPFADTRASRMLATLPDPAVSSYGTSARSLCYPCHQTRFPHNANGASAGCLDCHDEHAENVGEAANVRMVPRQLPNRRAGAREEVTFAHGGPAGHFDFFVDDSEAPHVTGAGVCDNGACHAGLLSGDGTPAAPLKGLMTGGHHGGGDQPPLSDCRGCHSHEGAGGSFGRAEMDCNDCHGYPPLMATPFNPVSNPDGQSYAGGAGAHQRH